MYFKEDHMTQQLEKIVQGTDYRVQPGDTRGSIAMRAYNNANKWKLIYNANEKELENFRRRPLPPGMVLYIPPEAGVDGGNLHSAIKQGTDYRVQPGDTRGSIAMRTYKNFNKWRLIYNANKKELENFHDRPLLPGMVLHIPAEGGGDGGNLH
jgi:nucleoid-associated protein YgaU